MKMSLIILTCFSLYDILLVDRIFQDTIGQN